MQSDHSPFIFTSTKTSSTYAKAAAILFDIGLYCIYNIVHVLIRNIGSGRKAHARLEDSLTDAIDIGWIILVNRLFMHGFPSRARLDVGGIKGDAHRLDVGVRLAVGMGRGCRMSDTGGTADSTGDNPA